MRDEIIKEFLSDLTEYYVEKFGNNHKVFAAYENLEALAGDNEELKLALREFEQAHADAIIDNNILLYKQGFIDALSLLKS